MQEHRKKILEYSFWLLGRREVSEKMLRASIRKKFPDAGLDVVDDVVDFLIKNKYLSDDRFAEGFIRYGKRNKWGPNKIRLKLREKGISILGGSKFAELIDAVEYEELLEHCRGKFKIEMINLSELDFATRNKLKARIFRYLAGKGFNSKVGAEILKLLLPN